MSKHTILIPNRPPIGTSWEMPYWTTDHFRQFFSSRKVVCLFGKEMIEKTSQFDHLYRFYARDSKKQSL